MAKNRPQFKVRTLNEIAAEGLQRFPGDHYDVGPDIIDADAIIVRSFDMHNMEIPESVVAVGRAGTGINNIPVEVLSQRGIPVFNAPGANANAVKELAVAGMLIAARNICNARDYVKDLTEKGAELANAVEMGKKQFLGFELPGKTLGVVGLGAVGVEIANVALSLGMHVVGYDPGITIKRAWQLSSGVEQVESLDLLFKLSNFVSTHVPLIKETTGMINADRLALMPKGGAIINFARGGIADNAAILDALDAGRLRAYVTDFPAPELISHPRIVALPHLGASTFEAEENCAIMVAENIKDYLENGNIRFSVNFPEVFIPRLGAYRIAIANANVPNMVGQISTALAKANLNIEDLLNKSYGDLAYTIIDVDGPISDDIIDEIQAIDGILALRNLGEPIS